MVFTIIRDGTLYDLIHQDMTDDVDFYLGQAKQIGGPILELCCGTGRITIPTAKAGLDITGLDLDISMLEQARHKANKEKINIKFLQDDATNFDLGCTFRLITVPFNSVQLFGEHEKLKSFFRCAYNHLQKDGVLIFDVFNPNLDYLAPSLKRRRQDGKFIHPETNEEIFVEVESVYDEARQINKVTFYYSTVNKRDYETETLEQRCFYPQEINALVEMNGFKLINKYGNFSGKDFGSGDPKQILVCRVQ